MTNQETENQQQKSSTSPPEETKDASAPPSNPDVDQDAVDKGQDNYDRVSGH
ncbi:MAG: hypothetical protein QOE06_3252 [Thermoleophilaceae bacterium]|jgi:hypothetical protein|nr:hypothetical protein [Thermoleophilaceae bacterium]